MESSKGLSPVVATIILIAFAVAIGGLVAIWLTEFTNETQEFTQERGQKSTLCSGAMIKVDSVTETGIVYSNPVSETIANITVYDSTGRNLTVIGNGTTLSPGQVGNVTWTRSNNLSVFMRGLCKDTVIVEGKCQKGQSCWK